MWVFYLHIFFIYIYFMKIIYMNKKKIKVLVVASDRTGVSYFRSTKPHLFLEEMYPDEFHIDIEYEPKLDNDEWLSQYDIIHYHRNLGPFEQMKELNERLDRLGIVSIMDIDDYWAPGPHHPAHLIIKANEIDKKILGNIKIANHITTTTPLFAQEISKYNKSVSVIPNSIDSTEKQFIPAPTTSDRIRIGWLGGSSHQKDLELLGQLVNKLRSANLLDKIQFVICGFDIRGFITNIDPKTNQQTKRAITPMESVWYQYEKIFTDDYKTVSPAHKEHLLRFTKNDFVGVENEPYRRVWTKPISSYASNYNLFDISLAPIEDNLFNKMKSQLKVIESGFFKKPIIAQNFGPYQLDLVNAYEKGGNINMDANSFMVDTNQNEKDWFKYIKILIDNPSLINVLGENLHNTVKDTYSMKAATETRRDLYVDLYEKKNANKLETSSKLS